MTRTAKVVIIGGGYGGVAAAARLERRLPRAAAEVSLVNSTNSMLVTPMLSLTAAGIIDPTDAQVQLRRLLPFTRHVTGTTGVVHPAAHEVEVRSDDGRVQVLNWDRLVMAPGSMARPSTAPGVSALSFAVKTLNDAVTLRDHIFAQLEYAAGTSSGAERRRHATFIVVGGGHTGTELAAQLQAATRFAVQQKPGLAADEVHWVLLHRSHQLLGGHKPDPAAAEAMRVLQDRGVDVRLGVTVSRASAGEVQLSSGERISTNTLIWAAGIQAQRSIRDTGLPVDEQGRIVVDDRLAVAGHSDVFAVGDAARVEDRANRGVLCPPTATHAASQGRTAADNLSASLGFGSPYAHEHHDEHVVVNLGDREAVGHVAGVPVTGTAGWLAVYSRRLAAIPAGPHRLRLALDWAANGRGPQYTDTAASTSHRSMPSRAGLALSSN